MARMEILKPCQAPNCHNTTSGRYCLRHKYLSKEDRPNYRERGYSTAWDKAKKEHLKQHPRCADCSGAATDVHHLIDHKGDKSIFWNRENWISLCHSCHSRRTAKAKASIPQAPVIIGKRYRLE